MLEKCNYIRLFGNKPNFYKANLNCHTNISDGNFSPEEIKELYKSQGYSIVAYSDADVMIPHHDLTDENFVALTACEYSVDGENGKSVHFNAISLDKDNDTQPLWHREKYVSDFAMPSRDKVKFDTSLPDYERDFSVDGISKMMQDCHDAGFFVTLNHPRASAISQADYTAYSGMDAIEIMNYSSIANGVDEYNGNIYEDILKSGKRPYCVAGDENRNEVPFGSRYSDACGAYTMINAEKLDYESVANALRNGSFYTTEGPEIYDLWYRSEVLYIRCSPVDKIIFESATHRKIYCGENGHQLDGEGIFFWAMPDHGYARVTIIDKNGKKAYSNAYSTNMLFYTYDKLEEGRL